VSSTAKTPFWRLSATVPFLVLFFRSLAPCQEGQGAHVRGNAAGIDYSNSHSFPNIVLPKAKIFKSFNEELAMVEIVPSDRLPEPCPDDVPTLTEALREAASHRPEIEQVELNLLNQQVVIQAIHNSPLPSLDVYASYYLAGLDGALRPTFSNIGRGDFPNFSYGATVDMPIRNRTAQADATRALLEQRRLQMKLQDAKNQAV
jgi:outer membrane protein